MCMEVDVWIFRDTDIDIDPRFSVIVLSGFRTLPFGVIADPPSQRAQPTDYLASQSLSSNR